MLRLGCARWPAAVTPHRVRVAQLRHGNEYAYAFTGKARELLAKAEAAARAFGVPCDSTHVVSDKPAAAIVEAAHARRYDLIFMASHGRRGKIGMASAGTKCQNQRIVPRTRALALPS